VKLQAAFFVILALSTQVSHAQTAAQIVNNNFPTSLKGSDFGFLPDSCYSIISGDEDHPALIIAAYDYGSDAVIEMISAQPDGSYRPTARAQEDVSGGDCQIQTADFFGDGSLVSLVTFSDGSARNTEGWLYRWDGQNLDLVFAPLGKPQSILNPDAVDIFHDGTKQIVSRDSWRPIDPQAPPSLTPVLYRVTNGVYTQVSPVLFYADYSRQTGKPHPETFPFELAVPADTQAPYILHVLNGSDTAGDNRASSAHVSLNGVEVVGPSQLNQNVAKVDVTVDLKPQNTISVLLDSQPGAKITVWIEGTPLSQK